MISSGDPCRIGGAGLVHPVCHSKHAQCEVAKLHRIVLSRGLTANAIQGLTETESRG